MLQPQNQYFNNSLHPTPSSSLCSRTLSFIFMFKYIACLPPNRRQLLRSNSPSSHPIQMETSTLNSLMCHLIASSLNVSIQLFLFMRAPVSYYHFLPPLFPKSILSPFPFRKDSASKRLETNKTKQNTLRKGKHSHIEARKGNPIGGKEPQEQVTESETLCIPTVWSPTKTSKLTPVTYTQRNWYRSLWAVCLMLRFFLN